MVGFGIDSMFKKGHKHLSGLDEVVLKNIDACKQLSHINHTSLGPSDMNKMVINHLDKLLVRHDAATIVNEIEVQHPAAKILDLAGKAQQEATEIELARRPKEFSFIETGLDQYTISKFAEGVEMVPKTLSENAGLSAMEFISSFYAEHSSENTRVSIDLEEGACKDVSTMNIWNPYITKFFALKYAADAACTVLRVDQLEIVEVLLKACDAVQEVLCNFSIFMECKFWSMGAKGTMVTVHGHPLMQIENEFGYFTSVMVFGCWNIQPLDFAFGNGWQVEYLERTKFQGTDLRHGEFAEYDEKAQCPVMISNLPFTFSLMK